MLNRINEDLKAALRAKDTVKLDVLRSLKTAISNAALRTGNVNNVLPPNEVLGIIRKQISQREDSVAQFVKGNRLDLSLKEEAEIKVLKEYLPAALSPEEVTAIVKQAITETGATSKKDMGKAIKRAVELAQGAIDNKTLSTEIGKLL
jgi:uncharacterized protein YqeY